MCAGVVQGLVVGQPYRERTSILTEGKPSIVLLGQFPSCVDTSVIIDERYRYM